jgi:hypothetical protein
VREARLVGLAADGRSLIVERDGEHLRLPVDDRLRAALDGDVQMPMPLTARLSPREIQQRIRCGESAADIARETGVAVELIARFEGPVLAERNHIAERAQKIVVDGTSLGDRVRALADRGRDGPVDVWWDAWVGDDGEWRVLAAFADGRTACWRWHLQAQRLRPIDDVARAVYGAGRDDLEAVLRPVAWERGTRAAELEAVVVPITADAPFDQEALPATPAADGGSPPDAADRTAEAETAAAVDLDEPPPPPPPTSAPEPRRKRATVPSWDEIIGRRQDG